MGLNSELVSGAQDYAFLTASVNPGTDAVGLCIILRERLGFRSEGLCCLPVVHSGKLRESKEAWVLDQLTVLVGLEWSLDWGSGWCIR